MRKCVQVAVMLLAVGCEKESPTAHGTPKGAAPARGSGGTNASIGGRVELDGKPLSHASIRLWGCVDDPGWSTRTSADGTFEVAVYGYGSMCLDIEHAAGYFRRKVRVESGDHVKGVEISIHLGRIEGVVVDEAGRPLTVAVTASARDRWGRRTVDSEADGTFAFERVERDTYAISVAAGATQPLEVTLDAQHAAVTGVRVVVGPPPPPDLQVVALDEAGAPVEGALVTVNEPTFETTPNGSTPGRPWFPTGVASHGAVDMVLSSQFALDTRTDRDGRFVWKPNTDGPYAILLIAPDGRVGMVEAVVREGRAVEVTLAPAGKLRVLCRGFRPMTEESGMGVNVSRGKLSFYAGCDETLGDLPAGRYQLAAKKGMHEFAASEVIVSAGDSIDAILEVLPKVTLHGVVTSDLDGAPVEDADCRVEWPFGEMLVGGDPPLMTGPDGAFEVSVSSGRIGVRCKREEYTEGTVTVDLATTTEVSIGTDLVMDDRIFLWDP